MDQTKHNHSRKHALALNMWYDCTDARAGKHYGALVAKYFDLVVDGHSAAIDRDVPIDSVCE